MNNMENMNAINDMGMAKVAGGEILGPTIFDLGTPIEMKQRSAADSDPVNHFYPPLGRPLPFPVELGGKAPVEAPHGRPMPGLPGLYPIPYDPTSPEYYN